MSESFKIESHDLTIADIFKDFYSVPDFQREYVWKPKNVEKLLQDVHDEFYNEDGRLVDGPEYFLGTIVGCKESGIYRGNKNQSPEKEDSWRIQKLDSSIKPLARERIYRGCWLRAKQDRLPFSD